MKPSIHGYWLNCPRLKKRTWEEEQSAEEERERHKGLDREINKTKEDRREVNNKRNTNTENLSEVLWSFHESVQQSSGEMSLIAGNIAMKACEL